MLKVRTLIRFTDLEANIVREPGSTFDVSEERLSVILSASPTPLVRKLQPKKRPSKTHEELDESKA